MNINIFSKAKEIILSQRAVEKFLQREKDIEEKLSKIKDKEKLK